MVVKVKLNCDKQMKEVLAQQCKAPNAEVPDRFTIDGHTIENGASHTGLAWDMVKQCIRDFASKGDHSKSLVEYLQHRIEKPPKKQKLIGVASDASASSRDNAPGMPSTALANPDQSSAAAFKEWMEQQFKEQRAAMRIEVQNAIAEQRSDIWYAMADRVSDDPEEREELQTAAAEMLLNDANERTEIEDKAVQELLNSPSKRAKVEKEVVAELLNNPFSLADLEDQAVQQLVDEPSEQMLDKAAEKWLEDLDDEKHEELEERANKELKKQLKRSVKQDLQKREMQKLIDIRVKEQVDFELARARYRAQHAQP